MALSSALFAGSSGLSTLGDTMQIIGDNIANVNTIGFKSSKATFQDLLSQSVSTMSGTAQVGSGSTIGEVSASFEQGSFETTGNATDLAIGGDGFFVLRETNGEGNYYSRAGNFGFDEDGYMANPDGYIVQGWALDSVSGTDVGSITDIHLNSFTSNPEESSQIQVIANLDSTGNDNSGVVDLNEAWDGTVSPPLADGKYEYQTTVQVYDSLGSTHDITIYFDKTALNESSYEYIVTCNPDEDAISDHHPSADAVAVDVVAAATAVATAYTAEATASTAAAAVHTLEAIAATAIATAATGADAAAAAVAARATLDTTSTSEEQAASLAAVVAAEAAALVTTDSLATNSGLLASGVIGFGTDSGAITNISMEGINAPSDTEDEQFFFVCDFLGGENSSMSVALDFGSSYDHTDGEWVNDSLSTTQFAVASNTTYKTSDGYAAGELQDINVDDEGIITGTYSNGQNTPLYRVALANFQNEDGLVKQGGNLFSSTLASGDAITNKPGTNGLGSIAAGSLEQSNVDIAEEFVRMITTQRGYQANSKIITTVDSMLSELMNLKR